jgi:hypothetical protein
MLVHLFVPPPSKLLEMHVRDARHILAARSWCVLRKAALDPLPRMEGHLLSDLVAIRFSLLMEAVTQIWPEPFAIHRPCCGMASIDEALLAQAIRLAAAGQCSAFETLLKEMLPGDARALLFSRARALYD